MDLNSLVKCTIELMIKKKLYTIEKKTAGSCRNPESIWGQLCSANNGGIYKSNIATNIRMWWIRDQHQYKSTVLSKLAILNSKR